MSCPGECAALHPETCSAPESSASARDGGTCGLCPWPGVGLEEVAASSFLQYGHWPAALRTLQSGAAAVMP